MIEHPGVANWLPLAGVEVELSNTGKRESREFYKLVAQTRVANKRGSPVWPEQHNGP